MKRARTILTFLIPAVLLLGARAFGQEQAAPPAKLLLVGPESKFVDAAGLAALGDHLRALAKRYPSLSLVADKPEELRKRARCVGLGADCLRKMGKLAQADRVLACEVQMLPGRQLAILTLLEVKTGIVLNQSRQRAGEGQDELRNAVTKGWVDLLGPLATGHLKVFANVSGADVSLDGTKIGQTPLILTKDLGEGTHQLEVTHEGYEAVRQEVRSDPGKDVRVDITLTAKAEVAVLAPVGQKLGGDKEEVAAAPRPEGERQPTAGSVKPDETRIGSERKQATRPVLRLPSDMAEDRPIAANPDISPPRPVEEAKEDKGESRPIYKQWWFWTAVGAVVAAGAITTAVLLTEGGGGIPGGKGRLVIDF